MVTVLTLGFLLVAAPAPPSGPKPRVEEVKVDKNGPYLIGHKTVSIQKTSVTTVTETFNGTVIAKQVPYAYFEEVQVFQQLYLDADKVEVFSRQGKKLEPAEVRKLLAKPAKVLVSTDGKPIDPLHVERMSEGIALVVSPSLVKPEKKTEAIAAPKVATPEP